MYIRFLPHPPHLLSWITFVFLRRLLKQMVIIASAALIVQIFHESLKMPPDGIYYEKDFDICKKRYAWKQPLLGVCKPPKSAEPMQLSIQFCPLLVPCRLPPSKYPLKQLNGSLNTWTTGVFGPCQRQIVTSALGSSPIRFEPEWYPFLTSHDLFWSSSTPVPSEVDTVLQKLDLPFGLKDAALVALDTLQWIPHQEIPKSISSLHCKTCIVVGNGNTLLGQSLGKFIDSHHVIIRINDAPLKGYENDVGEKTTFRLFFPESALSDPLQNSDNDTVFVLVPFKMVDLLWVKEVLRNKKEREKETLAGFWRPPPMVWKGRASHLRIMNPYVNFQATYRFLQLDKKPQRYSTTGLIAVNFALHLCQEVNIVGFGYPPANDRTSSIHYYGTDRLTNNMARIHNLTAEQKWLLKMQEREMISNVLSPSASWVWGPRPQW